MKGKAEECLTLLAARELLSIWRLHKRNEHSHQREKGLLRRLVESDKRFMRDSGAPRERVDNPLILFSVRWKALHCLNKVHSDLKFTRRQSNGTCEIKPSLKPLRCQLINASCRPRVISMLYRV